MKISTYLYLAAAAALITLIRMFVANGKSKREMTEAEQNASENKIVLDKKMNDAGLNADAFFEAPCASAALDEGHSTLLIATKADIKNMDGDGVSNDVEVSQHDLNDVASIEVIDESGRYQEILEMHCYYTGVKRDSVYKPYGHYSNSEVKQGERDYRDFIGKTVYGIRITSKTGHTREYAFYCGTESAFWTQKDKPEQLRQFADRCRTHLH